MSDVREMAVTVADDWQHSDLASLLMKSLIESARQHGIRELYAVELSDNQGMREFAQKFGMIVRRDPSDATQVTYSLSL
jgi:N-acetylglutamate synthase-like GNAT family acetyltransferase